MHQLYRVIIRLILFSLFMITTATTYADSLESLLMPGPVIKAHKKYEQNCDQCHDTSNKKQQWQLCVKCHDHKNIIEDLNNKTGFHGRLPEKAKTDCKHCHAEHKGRKANIVLLNPSTCDHRKTDFPLKGTEPREEPQGCRSAFPDPCGRGPHQ